jgi:hypothetical protein
MMRLALLWVLGLTLGAQVEYPLRASANGRYLEDQRGRAFLYHADTAWLIFTQLTLAEADEYMELRRAQGFNTLQVQIIMSPGMKNRAGHEAFVEFDFARPVPEFFAHVEAVLQKAQEKNLLVAIAPLWAGCCREGWAGNDGQGKPLPMMTNGPEKCEVLGRWLGERFARFRNVAWILGGDNDPREAREHYRRMGRGLRAASASCLITYHASSTHSSTDVYTAESWLNLSMVYTYFRGFDKAWNKVQPDVYEVAWTEYQKRPVLPFILGESTYEGEHEAWGSALQARKQAWWAVLAGAAGHAYGSPIWRFPANWREVVQMPGAKSLLHLRTLMERLQFERLRPDNSQQLVDVGQEGFAQNNFAVTAVSEDRKLAITYLPGPRAVKLLPGKAQWRVSWYDPGTGKTQADALLRGSAVQTRMSPLPADAVLILQRD